MNIPYEARLAVRYAVSGKNDKFVSFVSLMSAAGIALGVAALIVVLSVMQGFHQELRGRILSVAAHLEALATDSAGFVDWQAASADYLAHPQAVAAAPNIQKQALLTNGAAASGALARGIVPSLETQVSDIAALIPADALAALRAGEFNVVLGRQLARRLQAKTGDSLRLLAPQGSLTAVGFYPRFKRVRVAGVFSSGLYQFDETLAYMHMDDAAAIFRLRGPTSVRLKLQDVMRAPQIKEELQSRRQDAAVYDWTTSHGGLFRVLALERRVMFVILSLIVAVAAFNIVSALVTMIRNKRGDIAILRAMGATGGGVARVFMLHGLLIGAAGVAAGVALGWPLAANAGEILQKAESLFGANLFPASVYFLDKLPSRFDPTSAAWVALLALALSLLATAYPAYAASQTHPAEALKNEA